TTNNNDQTEQGVQVDPTAGPVIVKVRYEIDQCRTREFLDAIFALRRVRLRDGVRRWRLCQDIEDDERWLECFEFSSWADYLRFSSRRVVSDTAVRNAVLAVCRGNPVWSRHLERTAQSLANT
ncbi:MAG: MFS transporter, partial [Nitrospira sp.]|nr:MFS transporter [Nitrospira sp.]